MASTYHAHFIDFCHHDNNGAVMFPQHSPKVLCGFHHWALSSNVRLAISIALQQQQQHMQQVINCCSQEYRHFAIILTNVSTLSLLCAQQVSI